MTKNPRTIRENILATTALSEMEINSITCLFITDENTKVTGILHIHDLLRSGVK